MISAAKVLEKDVENDTREKTSRANVITFPKYHPSLLETAQFSSATIISSWITTYYADRKR